MASTAETGERAIAGVTHGLLGVGESVTWRGRHFGLMLTHESRITKYERPDYFQDVMVKGVFRSFVHDHFFEADIAGGTRMRDELRFEAPLGPLGRIAETLVLRQYLTGFLIDRNLMVRQVAEGPHQVWENYLQKA
jgi:ligand-binding SRPBCC domain-containing protein